MQLQSSCPPFLKTQVFEKFFALSPDKSQKIWRQLQLRETFTQGQLPPYRVEFDAPEQKGPFKKGELNIHHGPLLSAHGVIGEVSDSYRDLQYLYGSYVLSFRWIRPVRLEFFKEPGGLKLKLTSYVHPLWAGPWHLINVIFWSAFKWTL